MIAFFLAAAVFAPNGAIPSALVDGSGALYGTTLIGGTGCPTTKEEPYGCGVVFRVNYDGSGYTLLHAFSGADGRRPDRRLIFHGGTLYGRTTRGGKHQYGVIYRVNDDGSSFRVLYDVEGEGPSYAEEDTARIAVTKSGAVYAGETRADDRRQVLRLDRGAPEAVADYGTDAEIGDMVADGDAVDVLLYKNSACGWQLRQIKANGTESLLAGAFQPKSSPACMKGPFLNMLAGNGPALYGASMNDLYRIDGGKLRSVFQVDRSWSVVKSPASGGYIRSLWVTPDGRALLFLAAAIPLNGGSILTVGPAGDVRPVHVFSSLVAVPGEDTIPLALGRDYTMYAGVGAAGLCDPQGFEPRRTDCGSIVAIRGDGVRPVFALNGPEIPVRSSSEGFSTKIVAGARPGLIRIIRTTTSEPFAAQTPAPMRVVFTSRTAGAHYSLRDDGSTSARVANAPFGLPIPAREYSTPPLPADMYDVTLNGEAFGEPLYVAAGLPPVPAFPPGQTFFAVEGMNGASAMLGRNGKTLGATPLVLIGRSAKGLGFRIGNSEQRITVDGSYTSPVDVPGLAPVARDPAAERLDALYAGKTVWAFDMRATCPQDKDPAQVQYASGPLRVQHIYRLYGTADSMPIDSSDPFITFTAIDPLLVVFDPPAQKQVHAGAGWGTLDVRDCRAFYVLAADPWQLDHLFSARPPIDPSWPTAIQREVEARDIKPGMTRDMVIAVWGYPAVYGDAQKMRALSEWDYRPMGATVQFNGDVVVKYQPPPNRP